MYIRVIFVQTKGIDAIVYVELAEQEWGLQIRWCSSLSNGWRLVGILLLRRQTHRQWIDGTLCHDAFNFLKIPPLRMPLGLLRCFLRGVRCGQGWRKRLWKLRIMHELPWITFFGSRVRRFANDFHEWRSHEWKSLANRITSDPKIVIHGNECIILFLTRYLMSWTHNSAENNHRSLVSQLSPRTIVSGLALWRHHSGSVTSREREILALWRHICRLFLHAQIGAKAIFTSE